jgi:uncharacterized membrane protein (UPF0127 family)
MKSKLFGPNAFLVLFTVVSGFAEISGAMDKKEMTLGKEKLSVEIAQSEEEQEKGLMNRKVLPDGKGMLFIFKEEKPLHFWMKGTLIPLSIGYFSKDKILLETLDMEPASPMDQSPIIYSSKSPAMYALEVPKGWFKRKKIKLGNKFVLHERN